MTSLSRNQSTSTLGALSALILGAIAIWAIWFTSADQPTATNDQLLPLQDLPQEPADMGESLAAAQVALNAAQGALSKDAPSNGDQSSNLRPDEALSSPSPAFAWDTTEGGSSLDEAQRSIPLPDNVVVYEPVRVDMDSPDYPAPGQQRRVSLPGGEEWVVDVKSSVENPNGDYSWRGHLEGYGTDYPIMMTYGANSVFATITTPNGSYTLESINGSGWIYKNPSEFELSDPGKNDYLEVPHVHNN